MLRCTQATAPVMRLGASTGVGSILALTLLTTGSDSDGTCTVDMWSAQSSSGHSPLICLLASLNTASDSGDSHAGHLQPAQATAPILRPGAGAGSILPGHRRMRSRACERKAEAVLLQGVQDGRKVTRWTGASVRRSHSTCCLLGICETKH